MLVTRRSAKTSKPHLEATGRDLLDVIQSFDRGEQRTEDLVPHIVLSDEVSKESLIDAGTVCNLVDDHVSPSRPVSSCVPSA